MSLTYLQLTSSRARRFSLAIEYDEIRLLLRQDQGCDIVLSQELSELTKLRPLAHTVYLRRLNGCLCARSYQSQQDRRSGSGKPTTFSSISDQYFCSHPAFISISLSTLPCTLDNWVVFTVLMHKSSPVFF
jgi:hypothetical protein